MDSHDILLVDDNSSDAELAVHSLRQAIPNSIAVVEDGREALDYLFCQGNYQNRSSCEHPRVILLDLKLPKMDGLEVLKIIKADGRTRAIPVVILTSSKEATDLAAGYKLGASAFIQKPVAFEDFRKTMQEIGLFWLHANQPPPPEAFSEGAG